MRAAHTDRRAAVPGFYEWTRAPGHTYETGDTLLMALAGTSQSPLIPVSGAKSVSISWDAWTPPATAEHPRQATFWQARYYASDGRTLAFNSLGFTTNGTAPTITKPGEWESLQLGSPFTLGPEVRYLKLSLLVTASYGVPGTRVRRPSLNIGR